MTRTVLPVVAAALLAAPAAQARVCEYRPSELLRSDAAASVVAGAKGAAGDMAGGIFTLTNTVTGASLLGGNAGAGALGQLGGAATAIGNGAAAVLAAPGAAVAGAVAAVGIGAYEGICYFSDERITRYEDVLAVMDAIALGADPAFFRVERGAPGKADAVVVMGDGTGASASYPVRKLYIVNGVLMHRDWGLNTVLGDVGFAAVAAPGE